MALQQDFRVKKGLFVSDSATVSGNASISGSLTAGNTTLSSGALAITANASQASLAVVANSQTFSSNATAVAIAIAGNTTATSTTIGGTTLTSTANTTLGGTTASVTANATISGTTLAVNANTTLGGTSLSITANTTAAGRFDINGPASIAGALTTSANSTLGGTTVTVNGNTTVGGYSFTVYYQTVTVQGSTTFANNVVVSGNLTVSGTTTYINTQTLNIADNIVTLNADVAPATAPTENAGIEVNRGSAANSFVRWNETSDLWEATGNTGVIGELHVGGTGPADVSSNNAGGVVIQDVSATFDKFGHVTGLTVGTANLDSRYLGFTTIVAGNTTQANVVADLYNDVVTFANGAGVSITTNATTDTITFAHADTSSANSIAVDNAGGTVIQDLSVAVDEFGHITSISAVSANLDARYAAATFGTIVAGVAQANVVADTSGDVLTLTGSGSVTLTTNATTDTINISGLVYHATAVANAVANEGIIRLYDSNNANDNIKVVGSGSTTVSSNATHVIVSSVGETYSISSVANTTQGTLRLLGSSGANTLVPIVGSGSVVVSSNATAILVTGQVLDSVVNTSVTIAAAANSVKRAYDTAFSANTLANTAYNAAIAANTLANTAYNAAIAANTNASNASFISSGTLTVAYGGTGTNSLSGLLFGNGTAAVSTASDAQVAAALGTTADLQVGSLGVGVAAPGVAGEIRLAGSITTYATSDGRLKENVSPIKDPLIKLQQIAGVEFDWSDEEIQRRGGEDGYFVRKHDVGVIAQDVEAVLPEIVATRDTGYKAVKYELLVPLLIEAIKEQQRQIDELTRLLA